MAEKHFTGKTSDVDAPFVPAAFWEVGKTIKGVVAKVKSEVYEDKPQTVYVLELEEEVVIDDEAWDRVSIGNLRGFGMALEAAKSIDDQRLPNQRLALMDTVTIQCEKIRKAKKEGYSDRVDFIIDVWRR